MKVYGEVTLQKVPNENMIAHFYGNTQYLLARPLLTFKAWEYPVTREQELLDKRSETEEMTSERYQVINIEKGPRDSLRFKHIFND